MACRINIVATKLMRCIGYTSELLEQIKRTVWAANSIIHLFNTPKPATNLHSWKFSQREIALEFEYEDLVNEYSKMCLLPLNNKYKILTLFMNMLKNAASAYEIYGITSHAEFYCKQLLKNTYITPQIYLKAFMIYVKLNKTKCYPSLNQVMNMNEAKSVKRIRDAIKNFILNFLGLFIEVKEDACIISSLLSIVPLLQDNSNTTIDSFINHKLYIEIVFILIDYFVRYYTFHKKEVPKTLISILATISNTINTSITLISIHKQLDVDYNGVLKQAFKLLPSESNKLLNEILKVLFTTDQILDKNILKTLAKNLASLFSLLVGYKSKLRLLTLLYETIQQFTFSFHKKHFNPKSAYPYYMVYVCNFLLTKSKSYNIYSLWKFSSLALLDFIDSLSIEDEYVDFFNLDECSFYCYPSQISSESIGIMHVGKLQHVLVEKELKKRKSMDFGRQQAYYKLALNCFSSLNTLATDIISQRRRRSSLELTLISLNEEVVVDFTGAVAHKAKEITRNLSSAFEAGYTIVILNSNLAEIAADQRKHLKLYITRFRQSFNPIFISLGDKSLKEAFNTFTNIINNFYEVCDEGQKNKKDAQKFWFKCNTLDNDLKELLNKFEESLGPYKVSIDCIS